MGFIMKLNVHTDTLINGHWTGTGTGDFDPVTATELVRIGSATAFETKVVEVQENKSGGKKSSPALPVGQVSQKTTPKKSGRGARKKKGAES